MEQAKRGRSFVRKMMAALLVAVFVLASPTSVQADRASTQGETPAIYTNLDVFNPWLDTAETPAVISLRPSPTGEPTASDVRELIRYYENRFSVRLDVRHLRTLSYPEQFLLIIRYGDLMSVIPEPIQTTVVNYLARNGRVLTYRFGGDGHYVFDGLFNPRTITIDMFSFSSWIYAHEFGHLMHHILDELWGDRFLMAEWVAITGQAISLNDWHEDFADLFADIITANNFAAEATGELYQLGRLVERVVYERLGLPDLLTLTITPENLRGYADASQWWVGFRPVPAMSSTVDRTRLTRYVMRAIDSVINERFGGRAGMFPPHTNIQINPQTGAGTPRIRQNTLPFWDWDNYFAASAAYTLGLMDGINATTFGGNNPVTRAELVDVLVRTAVFLGVENPEEIMVLSQTPSPQQSVVTVEAWAAFMFLHELAMGVAVQPSGAFTLNATQDELNHLWPSIFSSRTYTLVGGPMRRDYRPENTRIVSSNPAVADARFNFYWGSGSDEVRIWGVSPGTATISFITDDYTHTITVRVVTEAEHRAWRLRIYAQ